MTGLNDSKTNVNALDYWYALTPGGVLKVDCEGCEYGTILCSDNKTLRRFDEIMIGYHHGYKNLVEKLEARALKLSILGHGTPINHIPKILYG